jgi:glycerol-3-phosphate dehydrogenase
VGPGQDRAAANDVTAFLAEANQAFPALQLTCDDVTLIHRGLAPAVASDGVPKLLGEPAVEDHSREGATGAMTVIGVKYTTARAVAEHAVATAARLLRKSIRRSATATTVLPGAGIADHEALAIETARRVHVDLTPATVTRLATTYGEGCGEIVRLAGERPELARPIIDGSPAIGAEIAHVIGREMAVHLTDILIRRTGLGAAGHPGSELISAAGAIAGREMHWSEDRVRSEIAAVERFYEIPG